MTHKDFTPATKESFEKSLICPACLNECIEEAMKGGLGDVAFKKISNETKRDIMEHLPLYKYVKFDRMRDGKGFVKSTLKSTFDNIAMLSSQIHTLSLLKNEWNLDFSQLKFLPETEKSMRDELKKIQEWGVKLQLWDEFLSADACMEKLVTMYQQKYEKLFPSINQIISELELLVHLASSSMEALSDASEDVHQSIKRWRSYEHKFQTILNEKLEEEFKAWSKASSPVTWVKDFKRRVEISILALAGVGYPGISVSDVKFPGLPGGKARANYHYLVGPEGNNVLRCPRCDYGPFNMEACPNLTSHHGGGAAKAFKISSWVKEKTPTRAEEEHDDGYALRDNGTLATEIKKNQSAVKWKKVVDISELEGFKPFHRVNDKFNRYVKVEWKEDKKKKVFWVRPEYDGVDFLLHHTDSRCPHCFYYKYNKSGWIMYGSLDDRMKMFPVVPGGLFRPRACADESSCYRLTDENWKNLIGDVPPRAPCQPFKKQYDVDDDGKDITFCDSKNLRHKLKTKKDAVDFLMGVKRPDLENSNEEEITKNQQKLIQRIMELGAAEKDKSYSDVLNAFLDLGWGASDMEILRKLGLYEMADMMEAFAQFQ